MGKEQGKWREKHRCQNKQNKIWKELSATASVMLLLQFCLEGGKIIAFSTLNPCHSFLYCDLNSLSDCQPGEVERAEQWDMTQQKSNCRSHFFSLISFMFLI